MISPPACRFFSRTTRHLKSASASEACSEIFARYGTKTPISVRTQLLDANQLHLLSTTLGRSPPSAQAPPTGTPIPPGHHLVYFTPSILEHELGLDGTDRTVNPLAPFTRRMWAGGEMHWTQDEASLLRVGQVVRETTQLLSAEPKTSKSGGEMLVVSVEKTFENDQGVALVDRRNWVFQKEIATLQAPPPAPPERVPFPEGDAVRDVTQSYTSLFRFSALTFNAHKIHYLPEWCRSVEGHRDAVVHGPLNLIIMLDLWRDHVRGGESAVPASVRYRAMNPLYVGEQYRVLLRREGKEWDTEIWDGFGKQSMKGHIIS